MYGWIRTLSRINIPYLQSISQLKNKILWGGFWATLIKSLSLPLNLILASLLAKSLSPADIAYYYLAFSLVSAASLVGMLGMDQTMVRIVASAMAVENYVAAKNTIILAFAWSGIGSLTIAIFIIFFGSNLGLTENLLFSVALWVVTQTIQNVLAEGFRSLHDIRFATLFQNKILINAILIIILLYFGQSSKINLETIILLIATVSGAVVILGIILLWVKVKKDHYPNSFVQQTNPVDVLNEALPILGINLLNTLKTQIGIWVIAAFLSTTDLALYGSAIRLVSIIAIPLITIVNAMVPPIIAELFAQNQLAKLEKTVRKLATFATIAASILTIIFLLGGESILGFIFGDFYKDAKLILVILSLGQLFDTASGSCGLVLIMTGHQKSLLRITAFSAIITISITFVAILLWGLVGSAWASTLGIILSNILIIFTVNRKLGIRTYILIGGFR